MEQLDKAVELINEAKAAIDKNNTGDFNTGDFNTGNRNTGDWNTGNRNNQYNSVLLILVFMAQIIQCIVKKA